MFPYVSSWLLFTLLAGYISGNTSKIIKAAPRNHEAEREALFLHNKFRKIHNVPEMKLNGEMCQSAADYAAKLARTGYLESSKIEERDGEGETLTGGCFITTDPLTVNETVTNWYREACNPEYTFGSEGMDEVAQFTQLVWKDSIELGFGKGDIHRDNMKCTYYVARYEPEGNMAGEFANNVFQGSFDKSNC